MRMRFASSDLAHSSARSSRTVLVGFPAVSPPWSQRNARAIRIDPRSVLATQPCECETTA